ncbi:MAG: hypothetical protein KAJ75_08430 [Alphaproteobacteria bacterium]|nr:hypothetical protein [Alphaproteobacteria bacterium]
MGLLDFSGKKPPKPIPVKWKGSAKGNPLRLLHVRTKKAGLDGVGGVFLIWHLGVQPNWVYIGAAEDVGDTIEEIKDNLEITDYERRGGLYMMWAPFKKEYWSGVVLFLRDELKPEVESCSVDFTIDEKAPLIPVLPPFLFKKQSLS